eukprot:CAMPEP_0172748588 /NCGR_PEP_ID=MMETSP1074-20121228/145355_1 /TAXON_ID=2916 /ORGANISM="Ceratium fusus, Strain PA161109" /LENGTH=496 /DNA_ID=CAMNT_0013580337 /DNA_START=51 /DNA_END=1538 /DNA_ORIENTATION=-
MTLSEVRTLFEQGLPKYCRARLLQGSEELGDNDVIAIELQAVVERSADKALAEISNFVEGYHEWPLDEVAIREAAVLEATAALGEVGELSPAHCELFVEFIASGACADPWARRTVTPTLAAKLGRSCANPADCSRRLAPLLSHGESFWIEMCAAIAVAEIDSRCVDSLDWVGCPLRSRLLGWSLEFVEDALRHNWYYIDSIPAVLCACRVIGRHGDSGSKRILRSILDNARCHKVHHEAELALELLCARVDNHVAHVIEETAFAEAAMANGSGGGGPQSSVVDRFVHEQQAPEGIVSEIHDLSAEELRQSANEAFERENSELLEALRNSKADSPAELNGDGVVLLRLDRHARAEEVVQALLSEPSLAACRGSLEEAGCELRPSWANGAWLLVPITRELYEEAGLCTSAVHVLLLAKDEAAVRCALKAVPKVKRPQLRTVRRGDMPESLPSSASNPDTAAKQETVPATENLNDATDSDGEHEFELIVDRTFLTLRLP